MADALCGPSNALQNFQKHTSVDRTLQQDRLTSRHSSSQGFRSSPGPNAGTLDSEFDVFQAGRAGPPQPDFHHLPPHLAHPPPPQQFAQPSQAPDWASDFQRLSLTTNHVAPIQQRRPQVSNAGSSWHQDFMMQQMPATQAPTFQQNTLAGMPGYGMSAFSGPSYMQRPDYGGMNSTPLSEMAQGKQRAQEPVPAFDEAAFEQAFAQAQQDMIAEAETELAQQPKEADTREREQPVETDPVLLRIQETRPAVYSAVKAWNEIGLGRPLDAIPFLDNMDTLEKSGQLIQDANEAKWVVETLHKVMDREAPQEVKSRAEELITSINERLMSTYPFGTRAPMSLDSAWEQLAAAGYQNPVSQDPQLAPQLEQQKEEHQPLRHDDDEMAETAGRLLERVADNRSEKFQNSQFLELMRRLRDREVRVEGDKMVETNSNPSASSAPPGIDPNILDHAAVDFNMPVDSQHEFSSSRRFSTGPLTDEISDQFRNYNIHGSYHR